MSATVTWSCVGSPPCSWESLLGEGSVSLNDWIPILNQWSGHWSCNSLCVDLQSSPSCSSWGVGLFVICWSVNLFYISPALKVSRMVVNVTYCNLWIDELKYFCVWIICNEVNVVNHGKVNGCSSIGGAQSL